MISRPTENEADAAMNLSRAASLVSEEGLVAFWLASLSDNGGYTLIQLDEHVEHLERRIAAYRMAREASRSRNVVPLHRESVA